MHVVLRQCLVSSSCPTSLHHHHHHNKMMLSWLYHAYALITRPFSNAQSTASLPRAPNTQTIHRQTPNITDSPSPPSPLSAAAGSSLNADEVAKFNSLSSYWWDENGQYSLLHLMNPTRVSFIRDQVSLHYQSASPSTSDPVNPFRGLRILDVGTGGGLLAESLARLGGTVTGIDAAADNIRIAQQHATLDPALRSCLSYHHLTAEQLLAHGHTYDVVCALEIIEHVNQPQLFAQTLANLTRPGGLLFISTINRNTLAYLTTILAAEYILQWVSKGTHDYNKLVTPQELSQWLHNSHIIDKEGNLQEQRVGMYFVAQSGMLYDLLSGTWSLYPDRTEVNYILCTARPS